jgi:lauroyl/myristoyl acyltransferase
MDIILLAALPMMAATAWVAPPRTWPAIARFSAPLAANMLSRGPAAVRNRIRDFLGDRTDLPAIARELAACEIEKNFQTMRDHLPWRWRPDIEIAGHEHIDAALANGRGAVLWDSHFYFASLITKMALHRAGYRLHHLSDPTHGFSDTRFGIRVLNPVRTSVECRYLGSRVVLGTDGPRGALRQLLGRLKENGLVSVTVRPRGLFPAEVPLFASTMKIATGGPDLAFTTGAALLPVFTVRRGDGIFAVNVDAQIPLKGSDRRAAAESAAREYARRLEPYVRAYPGQWTDWINV